MSFILDNLTATIVGAILIGALVVLQMRDQHDAIEAVQLHRSQVMAGELISTMEREIENARGRDETERVFSVAGGGTPLGPDEYRFRLLRDTTSDGTVYTRHASFPTLLDPDRFTASPIGIVTYHVEETGRFVRVDGRDRELLHITRYEFQRGQPLRETAFFDRLVDFDITAFEPDGTEILSRLEIAETPTRIHVDLRYAPDVLARQGGDEGAAFLASTRHARTVRIPAATAYERFGDTPPVGPGGIPIELPGDLPAEGDPTEPPATDLPPGSEPDAPPAGYLYICHLPGVENRTLLLPEAEARTHASHGDTRGVCH